MKAFGVEKLSEKTGHSLSIIYRWMNAVERGDGIRDKNKRKLISVTRGSEHAITWGDFDPDQAQAA